MLASNIENLRELKVWVIHASKTYATWKNFTSFKIHVTEIRFTDIEAEFDEIPLKTWSKIKTFVIVFLQKIIFKASEKQPTWIQVDKGDFLPQHLFLLDLLLA